MEMWLTPLMALEEDFTLFWWELRDGTEMLLVLALLKLGFLSPGQPDSLGGWAGPDWLLRERRANSWKLESFF